MRESKIEKELTDKIHAREGQCYKFVSPGRRGVPDRLVLLPIANEEHQKIVARYVRFVETKAPGKKPEPHQQREHKRLWQLGFSVSVLDTIDNVLNWIALL